VGSLNLISGSPQGENGLGNLATLPWQCGGVGDLGMQT